MKKLIAIISSLFIFFSTMSPAHAFFFKREKVASDMEEYNIVILGGGIGALTSGIYLSRAGYKPLIIEGELPGGLITQSHSVENWPGEMEIKGTDLVDKIKLQAEKNGCTILSNAVVDIDFSKKPYVITLKDINSEKTNKIRAASIIIAMGTSSNYLNIEGEKKFWGRGVSNCAICDGSFYKDKKVAIIGGGDAAIVEANYLSKLACEVVILVRKDTMRAKDKEKINQLQKRKNVRILYNTEITAVNGKDKVSSVEVFNNKTKQKSKMDFDGVFLAIGSKPNSEIFNKKLKLDNQGYIKVFNGFETSQKGVYAIGDIIDPVYKQAITAAGDGAKAAITCQKFLEDYDGVIKEPTTKATLVMEDTFATKVVEITSTAQFEKELNCDMPVIVDFYASWCRPCQRISPFIDQKAKSLSGKVKVLKVNVDKLKNISSKYQIRSMPTIVVFDKDKNVLFSQMGTESISDVFNSLDNVKDRSIDEINMYLQKMVK
ncbi:MAG: Thioredoxin reductase [Candidatus Anoxychlamydiales bacterium]|nr:Thioredoxin reductase [Candidatus Anoxychlamydiales bacterium]